MRVLLAALTLLPSTAFAFCGHYVGSAGAELYNHISQVSVVRHQNRTVLTLNNDVEGNAADFALVIPVPEVLAQEDIRVVERSLFETLDAYSAPRLVYYECEDFYYDDADVDTDADADPSDGGGNSDPVTVEAEYAVGEYNVVILSSTESAALVAWLRSNGYEVPLEAEDLLGEYIDSGSYFLAAQVALDAEPVGRSFLSPLQFSYDTPMFSIPIRIGTLSSPGVQDLLVYAITDQNEGRVQISNYPEALIERDCMADLSQYESFGAFYEEMFSAAWSEAGEASWAVEYAWAPSGCDPCSSDPPSDEQLWDLGWPQEENVYDAFFTRLHVRYTPEAATQDLSLYTSGLSGWESFDQIKYIRYDPQLEDRYPVCGVGYVEDPGTCSDGPGNPYDPYDEDPIEDLPKLGEINGCAGGCTVVGDGGLGLGVLLVGFLGLWRRRRT